MAIPIVDPTSSILSYPQWLEWQFFFTATQSPTSWSVQSGGFPTGMSFQPKQATTGVASTDILTATGTAFTEGTNLQFATITGGAGLTAGTNYFVTNPTGATFQLATTLGGAPINFTTDITAGAVFQPGLLIGAATVPGISTVSMVATNSAGDSLPVLFAIGIEPAAATATANADVIWDLATDNIIAQTSSVVSLTPAALGTPTFYVKEKNDFFALVRFVKDGTAIPLVATVFNLVLKQFEPGPKIVVSDAFSQPGGDNTAALVHATFSGNDLAAALSNYVTINGTSFLALAEFEITYNNPFGIGPAPSIIRTSRTFQIQIERDLGETL